MDVEEHTEAKEPEPMQVETPAKVAKKNREQKFLADLEVAEAAARKLAEGGQLQQGIDDLFKLEKKTRLVLEFVVTAKVAVALVKLCKGAGDWQALKDTIILLAKRRQQHKKVIIAYITEAITYIDDAPDEAAYLQTLLTICEGKIYLEIERARLTRRIATIKETAGDVAGAAKIMQTVAVETYGSMDGHEKADFILEQMRLCQAQKDFVRTLIVSEKIDKELIEKPDYQDIKLRFYSQLSEYYHLKDNTLELCRCNLRILHTPKIQADDAKLHEHLQRACLFVALSSYGKTQQQLLFSINTDESKELEQIPAYKNLLKFFTTKEIIQWPLQVGPSGDEALKTQSIFKTEPKWELRLKRRVTEHNVRVIAHWYTRIRLDRFAELLDVERQELENIVSRMVCIREDDAEPLYAKIDRPEGIISFVKPVPVEETLSDWASDLSSVMKLIESTKFLIDKEVMMNAATE